MPGSLDPPAPDIELISPGPWQEDATDPERLSDTEFEDVDGHRIGRVYKTSDLDASALPWSDNLTAIQNLVGYMTQVSSLTTDLATVQSDLDETEDRLRARVMELQDIEAQIRRLKLIQQVQLRRAKNRRRSKRGK